MRESKRISEGTVYPKTKNYLQKYITRKLFGKAAYKYFKALKVRLLYKAGKSFEISEFLIQILVKESVIFDIGANLGQYAIRLAGLLGNEGKFICAEPVEDNYRYLLKLKNKYRFKSMECFNYAVSDFNGEGKLYIPVIENDIELDTRATIDRENYYFSYEKYNEQKVKVVTLEKLFNESGAARLDIIKSDTEGNDGRVIEGGLELIKKYYPLILVEDSHREEWVNKLYEIGYLPFYVKDSLKLKDAYSVQDNEGNVIFDLLVLIHTSKIENYKKYILKRD